MHLDDVRVIGLLVANITLEGLAKLTQLVDVLRPALEGLLTFAQIVVAALTAIYLVVKIRRNKCATSES